MPEIRTVRWEDWMGNVYKFEGTGTGSGGVDVPSEDIIKDGSTDGTITDDLGSNGGKVIQVGSSPTVNKNVATVEFEDLPFGDYSVMLRLKRSNTNGASLVVNTYYESGEAAIPAKKLSTTPIAPSQVSTTQYTSIGFAMKYTGTYTKKNKLKVEILMLANATATTIYFDTVTVSKSYTGLTGTVTTLY